MINEEITVKKIESKSYKRIISAGTFNSDCRISKEVFGCGYNVDIRFSISSRNYPATYMDPPESILDRIDIENLDEVIDILCDDGIPGEDIPATFVEMGTGQYKHKSGKIYTRKDINDILEEIVEDNYDPYHHCRETEQDYDHYDDN